jgi:hypothetical protein
MTKLDAAMPKICEIAAQAFYRYVEVSRDPCDEPPESFLQSIVFDKLGSAYPMTLESTARKIEEWNEDIRRKMLGKPPALPRQQNADSAARGVDGVLSAVEKVGTAVFEAVAAPLVRAAEQALERLTPNKRVDLVLFDNAPPAGVDYAFAGLIEFKLWKEGKDRDKLLNLLKPLETCPAAAVCCLTNAHLEDDYLQTVKSEAEAAGDRFYYHQVELPVGVPRDEGRRRYSVYARVFSRPA